MRTRSLMVLVTVSIVTVSCDEWNLVHFGEDNDEMKKCLKENSNLWDALSVENHNMGKDYLINTLVADVLKETMTIDDLKIIVASELDVLVRFGDLRIADYQMPFVVKEIAKAILKCSEKKVNNNQNYIELPRFSDETIEYGLLIDLILVTWEHLPEQIFSTQHRIQTFNNFSETALEVLDSIYSQRLKNYWLYLKLRRMWYRRSELFFDNENSLLPYIRHIYSMDYSRPYTRDSPNLFTSRIHEDYSVRNPPASRLEVQEIPSDYPVDMSNFNDYYMSPDAQTITKSDYYYEIHEKRFLKRLFLYLEMREMEVLGSANSTSIKDLLLILPNNALYSRYLDRRRKKELDFEINKQSYLYEHIQKKCFNELDLIMIFWYRVKHLLKSVATTTITSEPTSFTTDMSSTLLYKESKRGKGLIRKGSSGKWFPKQSGGRNDDSDDENPGPSCPKRSKFSNDRYYGYILGFGNQNKLSFSGEEKVFLEDLKGVFLSLIENKKWDHSSLTVY